MPLLKKIRNTSGLGYITYNKKHYSFAAPAPLYINLIVYSGEWIWDLSSQGNQITDMLPFPYNMDGGGMLFIDEIHTHTPRETRER